MLNAGQKLLSSNALTKYALAPSATGAVLGTGYGAYEKTTNPYARDDLKEYATKGALLGLGVGGFAASSSRVLRDYNIFKQSRYTNANTKDKSSYGLSAFGEMLARAT